MKPVLDQQKFDSLECNRCGQCCEDFRIRPPGDPNSEYWRNYKGPLGWLEWWAYWHVRGVEVTLPGHPHDPMLWIGQLTPRWNRDTERWVYSCGYYERDGDIGICTIHDDPPDLCSRFPYGTLSGYDKCTWSGEAVELLDFEVVQ